ncbi:AAA family ATPase [Elizabethkingia anophelis]|uniref:AAA family ATPase n=1 Tax=Elizabethkingia anophelis TaxID=1117645 RepID=UPI000C99FBFC|nr:AAA family ATPase [Elizabethkingia anophelis]MCT3758331.1 AAA family ATPase [Elizabethkingia anophelis]MCT3972021.1 AAA family ATPase [Elizabethkingia anophelis]MCT4000498.1 AAA family ATPase [Elizabethkingia anophelis]MCT4014521.1 AAA family ATPase [Elizabethkingia anophelis]MCT4018082.1 AAA family ATPase [Elizabethkingia anophelis]
MSLQIIAIKPLKECNSEYLKLLKEDFIYYFYREFSIDPNNDEITFNNKSPEGLYNIVNLNNKEIKVNISAVSGKNGSGKSTLIELFFLAINNFSHRFNKKNKKANLAYVNDIKVELYFKTIETISKKELVRFYKLKVYDDTVEINQYKKIGDKFVIGKKIEESNFKLKNFFYTVTINHSHYAYNTDEMGIWLDGLFHKNDAYQTPLVLNPMRTKGDFEINKENHLAKSRLIANLVRPWTKFDFRKLTDSLEAVEFKATINNTKRDKVIYVLQAKGSKEKKEIKLRNLLLNEDLIYEKLNRYYKFKYDNNSKKELRIAFNYLKYKLVNICVTYSDYEKYFLKESKNFDEGLLDDYFKLLFDEDQSHITFKLKQILNYLHFIDYTGSIKLVKEQKIQIKSISDFIANIKNEKKYSKISSIELIPPSIFNIDILLKTNKGKLTEFKKLSSGEKQMIYSVSSILYHLSNLDSVKTTATKTAYDNINIVLEEIELYFHPEMQRNFINHILNSISGIELNNVKTINFCFVSHSPFILSDIPHHNIMFLENEEDEAIQLFVEKSTFGANIHDLLKDGFFMNKGSIGEFAKNKISETIDWLNNLKDKKNRIEELDEIKKLNARQIAEKKQITESIKILSSVNKNHLDFIKIIDEPIIKNKLLEMYSEVFSNDERINYLEREKNRIIKEIEKLKNE